MTWKLNLLLLRRHFNDSISSWKVSEMKKAPKWKRATRKGQTSFFVFDFWNFKLVPIDSELNSALKNQTYFYKIFGPGTGKSSQTWKKWDKILQKRPLVTIATKLEISGTKTFFSERCPGTVLVKNLKFWFWPFELWSWPVSCQK